MASALPARVTTVPHTAPKPPSPDVTASGLAWLARAQHPDGHWDLAPGRTGLALLAFLSAGESHKHGKYKRTVRNGLKFLKQIQRPDGCFMLPNTPRSNRDHAIATLAMVEAYAITASPLFKQSAQQGVNAIHPSGEPDKLASRWAGIALHSANGAGLRVRREDSARIDLSDLGLWRPTSMRDPTSHYFGSWYAASIKTELDRTWRWDFREVAAGLQQADGSFEPTGRHRLYLGRVGSTALMIAATAMTFWSPNGQIR